MSIDVVLPLMTGVLLGLAAGFVAGAFTCLLLGANHAGSGESIAVDSLVNAYLAGHDDGRAGQPANPAALTDMLERRP